MKTVKKNVYYCDYCKKRGLSAAHMKRHETGCTANPNRVCGKCDMENTQFTGAIVEDLKKRFEIDTNGFDGDGRYRVIWKGEPVTLDEIRKIAQGCPNCMLAILRQTHLNYECCGLEPFDYKKEFKEDGGFSSATKRRYGYASDVTPYDFM